MIKVCRYGKRFVAAFCIIAYVLVSIAISAVAKLFNGLDIVTLSLYVDLVSLLAILCVCGIYENAFNDDVINRDVIKPTPRLIAAAIPFLTIMACVISIMNYLLSLHLPQSGMASRSEALSSAPLASTLFLTILVAPFFEETLFRYVLFDFFIDRNSKKSDIIKLAILSSVVFAVFHGTLVHIITGTIFGLFMCLVMYWTDSIGLCAFLHVINNAFTSMILGATALKDFSLSSAIFTIFVCAVLIVIGLLVFHFTADAIWHDTEFEWEHPLDHDRLAPVNPNGVEFTIDENRQVKSKFVLRVARFYARATGLIVMPVFGNDLSVYYIFSSKAEDLVNLTSECGGTATFLDENFKEVTQEEINERRGN